MIPRTQFRLLGWLVALLVLLAAVGCSPAPSPSAASSPSVAVGPSLTPVPGGTTGASPGEPPTQTDTAWGRIWDGIPATFPRFPDSIPTEVGEGPVSATLSVPAGPEEARQFMGTELERAGFVPVAMTGPFEDGSFVVSTGAATGCRTEVRLTPLSGTTLMTVMYGADCPFE